MITIEEQMKDYQDLGYILAECEECGETIDVEVDAATGFCHSCGRVVTVANHIINMGMV